MRLAAAPAAAQPRDIPRNTPRDPQRDIGPITAPAPTAALSGDPLFTARTPALGSRERDPLVSTPPPASIAVPAQRAEAPPTEFPRPDEPEADAQSRRVRVVLAERKGVARPVRTVVDIQEGTGVGELLRSNLIGSQLAVALRFAVGAGLTLGLLPLLFAMFPEIGRIDVLGLRLPWLLLGVLVYPFLFGLGWWHTRTAERVEQNFADHVQD
jgi:hypothetical protein